MKKTMKTCKACRHCGIEPSDMDFTCSHPDLIKQGNLFGLHIYKEPLEHCPDFSKFEQHPSRNANGTLKDLEL